MLIPGAHFLQPDLPVLGGGRGALPSHQSFRWHCPHQGPAGVEQLGTVVTCGLLPVGAPGRNLGTLRAPVPTQPLILMAEDAQGKV